MTLTSSDSDSKQDAAERPAESNMRLNAMALIASNMLTGLFGLLFWGAAAHLYPAREVGIASALITSATMLSVLSILSIDYLYERFLPLAGTRTGPLLKWGFLLVAGVALLSGSALVAFGPRGELFQTGWAMAAFPVLVLVLAVFTLLDKTTVGLGVARWGAAKNSVHGAAKLAVVLVFVATGSAVSIVFAWGATAAALAAIMLIAIRRRYRSSPRFLEPPTLPPRKEILSYFGSSWSLTAAWAIGPLIVPLIIVSHLGPESYAHFAVTWCIIEALYFTVHLVVSPFVAEVAAHPDTVASLSRRMVQMMLVVIVLGGVGLVVVAPILLGFIGADYRADGQDLLYLAAVFVPLSAVGAIYEGFARVERRLKLMIVVRCTSTLVIVVGSYFATRSHGVLGVGWTYIAAEAMSAVVLIGPVVLWLRRIKRAGELPAMPDTAEASRPSSVRLG